MILKKLKSGAIELDGEYLQFNCTCDDAMPYCQALCCRQRPRFNVPLESVDLFPLADQERMGELVVLRHEGDRCCYLEGTRCGVQAHKPSVCRRWHCSPKGKGKGLTEFGRGWRLWPGFVEM